MSGVKKYNPPHSVPAGHLSGNAERTEIASSDS
jgi:hypothetical protein